MRRIDYKGNGEWGMGNGEWGMGNGQWGMGNGALGKRGRGEKLISPASLISLISLISPTPHSPLPTPYSQLLLYLSAADLNQSD